MGGPDRRKSLRDKGLRRKDFCRILWLPFGYRRSVPYYRAFVPTSTNPAPADRHILSNPGGTRTPNLQGRNLSL